MILEIIFWILIVLETWVCVYSIEDKNSSEMESPGLFVLSIIGFCATMYFIKTDTTMILLKDLSSNWQSYLLYVLSYFTLGVLWSMFRWFVKSFKAGKSFKAWVNLNKDDKKMTKEWFEERRALTIPSASDNKSIITLWIIFWPLSGIRYFIGSALIDFVHYIFDKLSGIYNAITKKAFGNIEYPNKN